MFRSDYENSVVLLGPKGVGKTLISNTLAEKLGIKKVVSTDFLRSVLYMYFDGYLFNIKEFKAKTEKDAKATRINPHAPNKEKLLEAQQRDIDAYFEKVYSTAQTLHALKPNKKIQDLIDKIGYVQKMQVEHHAFTANEYEFLRQYFLLEFVDMYLSNVNEPVVLDMGGDLGIKYQLNEAEKAKIKKLFAQAFKQDAGHAFNFQKNFIEKFKVRIALVPSPNYYNSADPKVSGSQNKSFISHMNDYIDFANLTAPADGFSYDISNPVYKTSGHFFTYEDAIRDKLKDKGDINNLCDELAILIKADAEDDEPVLVSSAAQKRK